MKVKVHPRRNLKRTSGEIGHRAVDGHDKTSIWGDDVEQEHWLKVPKVLLRLGRYSAKMGNELQPRHILLVLALASRKFKDKPLVCSWSELARDLGIKRDTVRHWAYELRDNGLLKIEYPEGSANPSNRMANTFHLTGFVAMVNLAFSRWKEQRSQR